MSRILVAGGLVVLTIFAMSGCGLSSNNKRTQPTPSPSATTKTVEPSELFAPRAAELTTVPAKAQLTSEPYIKGKAVLYYQTISLNKSEGDKVPWVFDQQLSYQKVPTAHDPEEVGTVILRKCHEISLGTYEKQITEERIPVYGGKCEVTIIDKTIPAVIYRKSFQTELKDHKILGKDAKEIRESPPYIDIYNFLNGLPRK